MSEYTPIQFTVNQEEKRLTLCSVKRLIKESQPSLQYSLLTVMQTSGLIWKHAYPNTSL